jgi:hypothetical protein
MLQVAVAGSALAAAQAHAQLVKVDEAKDELAKSLGYKHDTTKVDAKAFPTHTKDQKCSACALFQGKAGEAWGGCGIFAGKLVAANGWCKQYVKKP